MFMKSLVLPGVEGPHPGRLETDRRVGPALVLPGRRVLRLSVLVAASPASPFGSSFKGCYSFLSLQSSVKLDSKSRHLLTVKLNCFGYFHIIINRGRMVISHLMAAEPGLVSRGAQPGC